MWGICTHLPRFAPSLVNQFHVSYTFDCLTTVMQVFIHYLKATLPLQILNCPISIIIKTNILEEKSMVVYEHLEINSMLLLHICIFVLCLYMHFN